MQLFVLLGIALCLVADTSTKSVTSTDHETGTGDLSVPEHGNTDSKAAADECKCENGFCEKNDKGKWVCKCPPEWGFLSSNFCKKCNCGKDSNCTFTGFWSTKTCICKFGYKDDNGTCKGDCGYNPCKNGGLCQVKNGEVTCQCKKDFGGQDCSIRTCSVDSDCRNGARCEENLRGKFCRCLNGTKGHFCEEVSGCQSLHCGPDALCTYDVRRERAMCSCQNEDLVFDEIERRCKRTCQSDSNCMNGGKCGASTFCSCLEGTKGDFCEEISDCKHMNCGPEARCTYDVGRQRAMCSCENYKLLFDSKQRKCRRPCYGDSDCRNGARCEENGRGNFCRCLNGTEGDFCEEVSECKGLNCGPDARCTYDARRETAMCSCQNEDLVFDERERRCKNVCYPNPCKNNGTCNATRGVVTCQCKDRFRGDDCSIDVCSPNPCKNGGTCNGMRGKATCQCRDRFRGDDCSIDVCYPNPCKNNGTCNGTRGEATCQCKSRFLGADCSIDICSPNPCKNNGTCNGTRGEATCECKDRFRGADCSIDVCYPNPCKNNGTCNGTRGEATCECKDRFRGADCSIDVCYPNPCKNGGTCNGTRGKATCECKDRFRGADCSIEVCYPNPCKNNGICNGTRREATCQCKSRFRGADCSIDVCWPNPCRNGGVCNVTREGAICQCRDHFTGADCSIEIPVIVTSTTRNSTLQPTSPSRSLNFTVDRESTLRLTTIVPTTGTDPCTESPCLNGGTCVTVGNMRKCLCKKPYLGNLCETDPCDWNPCKNGGMCKIEYETTRCFCREPFTGEFCESVIGVRSRIDTYVIGLLAATVFVTATLTFLTCILCQKYHAVRPRLEES